jgi:hypothetical protein
MPRKVKKAANGVGQVPADLRRPAAPIAKPAEPEAPAAKAIEEPAPQPKREFHQLRCTEFAPEGFVNGRFVRYAAYPHVIGQPLMRRGR